MKVQKCDLRLKIQKANKEHSENNVFLVLFLNFQYFLYPDQCFLRTGKLVPFHDITNFLDMGYVLLVITTSANIRIHTFVCKKIVSLCTLKKNGAMKYSFW